MRCWSTSVPRRFNNLLIWSITISHITSRLAAGNSRVHWAYERKKPKSYSRLFFLLLLNMTEHSQIPALRFNQKNLNCLLIHFLCRQIPRIFFLLFFFLSSWRHEINFHINFIKVFLGRNRLRFKAFFSASPSSQFSTRHEERKIPFV